MTTTKQGLSFLPVGPAGSATAFAAMMLVLASLPQALADQAKADGLAITNTWFRTIMPGRPASGYFMLRNNSGTPRKLVGAVSTACRSASLHETKKESGVAQMVRIEQIDVPANGGVTFAPGGYHVMCMKPSDAMKPGGTVPLTLKFADGTELTTDFAVRSITGE